MCRPLRGALFVEGKAEEDAAPILLNGLWSHLTLPGPVFWQVLYRGNDLKSDATLNRELDRFYRKLAKDFAFLLVMFDSDEKRNGRFMCPHDKAPSSAQIIRAKNLPIPAAVVLPHKEYEHWFAASLPQWAGRDIIDAPTGMLIGRFAPDTSQAHNGIHGRDGKGIIDRHLVLGAYGETTHQAPLTAMLDFAYLLDPGRAALADTVGFGPLRRACDFLATNTGKRGAVYPPERPPMPEVLAVQQQ